jgi:hypothetical protein
MPKVTSLNQAIDESIRLLSLPKYRTYKEVRKISEKLACQACIFELFDYSEDKDSIALGTGMNEKTVRFQRDGDQASLKSLSRLKKYLKRVKRRAKS